MAWVIDTNHSHVGFSVRHMMVSTVRGQFKKYSGTLNLNVEDFAKSSFEGEIEVDSIDTDNADRDTHLRTNDFFDVVNHPKITFKSTRIERKGDGEYVVHGNLAIRGVSKEVALDVESSGVFKNPWGQTVTGFSAKGSVNRTDFGVSFNSILEAGGVVVGEKVKIELEIEATKKD
jgi:polyisoprenoid-binding protein YceI